jgi:thiol-disulfide isomerase/thioredoxin
LTPDQSKSASEEAPSAAEEHVTAEGVLQAMVKAYKTANTYADNGEIRMTGQMGDQAINGKDYCLVALERPNKLRMQAYRGVLVVDGKKLSAFLDNVPNQVLQAEAQPELRLDWLLRDQGLALGMADGFTQPFSWAPLQAILLMAADPLKTLLHDAEKPQRIESAKIGANDCYRVVAKRPDGTMVFWIDKKSSVLRRFEYPTDGINQTVAGGQIKNLALVAEFADAQLGGKVDPNAFQFQAAKEAKTVNLFLSPDMMLLGKPAPEFKFVGLDGKEITPASLAGKVAVMDIWATWCGPCRSGLPLLEKVYQKYKDNDKVAVVAVSVDESKTEDKALRDTMAELKVNVPIARDPQQHTGQLFSVTNIPAMLVLDAKGAIQEYEIGLQPRLDMELPDKLEKLLAGESLYPAKLTKFEQQQKEFESWLKKQVADDCYWGALVMPMNVAKAEIGPRTEPQSLRIKQLWKAAELKEPGNIVVVQPPDKEPQVLVIDGGKAVVELTPDGKVAARHTLQLPLGGMASFLRVASAGDGRRWLLAGTSGLQQIHLFDEKYQHLLDFPKTSDAGPHEGIADAQMGDLDGDGTPEIGIGYWGVAGVQGVSLEGKRLWSNRSLSMVQRLTVLEPDDKGRRKLLCTNQRGTLTILDDKGEFQEEITIADHMVPWVSAADLNGDDKLEFCGLAPTNEGDMSAIGLGRKGETLWLYPLPKGVPEYPIEPICGTHLLPGKEGQWLIAAVDGSIHLLAADGKQIDHFSYGSALTGIAGLKWDGRYVLLVSTPEGLEAWEVQPPEKP